MSRDFEPDGDEMSLVEERYEEIDDQPIDDDNLSVFDEDELKSQEYSYAPECATSRDFAQNKQNALPRNRPYHYGGLSTIKEVNESKANISNLSVLRSRFGTPSKEKVVEVKEKNENIWNDSLGSNERSIDGMKQQRQLPADNLEDMSFQFGNGADAINQYEKDFLSDENKADRLFPENDIRFRGDQRFFEKENSWEPSAAEWQKNESPILTVQKSPNVVNFEEKKQPAKVFGNLSNNSGTLSAIHAKHTAEITTQTTPKTPERRSSNTFETPKARRSHVDASTPKGFDGIPRRASQLEDTRISSIHGDSPTRLNFFNSPSNTTAASNMTVNHSLVKNIITQAKGGDLKAHLEGIRKMRPNLPSKPDFSKKSYSRKETSVVQTAIESSRVEANRKEETKKENEKFNFSRNHILESKKREDSRMLLAAPIERTDRSKLRDEMARIELGNSRESGASIRSSSRASTSSTSSTKSRMEKSSNPVVKLSSRRIAFGAVEVGDKMILEMDIQNISEHAIKVKTTIDSQTKAFAIIDNGIRDILPAHKSVLRIAFQPDTGGRYQVCIKVKVQGFNVDYETTIPVWGCGGVVKIEPTGSNVSLSNTNDFVLRTSNYSKIEFRLKNDGCRDGFARIDVFDGLMKPVKCRVFPSHALMIRRRSDVTIEICLEDMIHTISENRSSSSLSSRPSSSLSSVSSRASSRRTTMSGADLIIEIKWGEELLRQRLKMLQKETGKWMGIDGNDFTNIAFVGEQTLNPSSGFPRIVPDDRDLFITSYRTTNIMVYSTRSAPRCSNSYRNTSITLDPLETTTLETTAFRQSTFVAEPDVTVVPRK